MLVGISRVHQLAQRSNTSLSRLTVQAIEDLAVHASSNVNKKRKHITNKVGHNSYRKSPLRSNASSPKRSKATSPGRSTGILNMESTGNASLQHELVASSHTLPAVDNSTIAVTEPESDLNRDDRPANPVPGKRKKKSKKANRDELRQAKRAIVAKAPSSWRRDDSAEPQPSARAPAQQGRFQVENPHMPKIIPRARSTSLNPQIYPDWWGHEYDADQANHTGFIRVPKRLRSADPCKAAINRAVNRHCEDTLDQRLRHVYDKNTSSFQLVASSSKKAHRPIEPYHVAPAPYTNQHHRTSTNTDPTYAYTKQSNVSPIRPANPGDKNTPMCYIGPPTQAEINRNRDRHNHNRNASSAMQEDYEDQARRQRIRQNRLGLISGATDESQTIQTNSPLRRSPQNEQARYMASNQYRGEDEMRASQKSAAMSYSPPGRRTRSRTHFQQQPFEHHYVQKASPVRRQGRRNRKPIKRVAKQRTQDYYGSNLRGIKDKNAVRYDYHFQQNRQAQTQGRQFEHVESKIKDSIAFFKNMRKDPNHQRIFDKEPQVFYKPVPKAGRDYGSQGNALVDDYYPEESGAPLRRRSPSREPQAHLHPQYLEPHHQQMLQQEHEQQQHYLASASMTEAEGEEGTEHDGPSSIEHHMNSSKDLRSAQLLRERDQQQYSEIQHDNGTRYVHHRQPHDRTGDDMVMFRSDYDRNNVSRGEPRSSEQARQQHLFSQAGPGQVGNVTSEEFNTSRFSAPLHGSNHYAMPSSQLPLSRDYHAYQNAPSSHANQSGNTSSHIDHNTSNTEQRTHQNNSTTHPDVTNPFNYTRHGQQANVTQADNSYNYTLQQPLNQHPQYQNEAHRSYPAQHHARHSSGQNESDDDSSSLDDDQHHPIGGGQQQDFTDDEEDDSSAMSDYNPDERVRQIINNRGGASEPEIVSQTRVLAHQQLDQSGDDDDSSSSEYSYEESPEQQQLV